MLERTLKVIRVSQSDEIFNRHYQLADFKIEGQHTDTNKQYVSQNFDPQINSIINKNNKSRSKSRSKSKEKKRDKKNKQNNKHDNYIETGLSKKQIADLRALEQMIKCSEYNKGVGSKKERKQMKIKHKKSGNKRNQQIFQDIPQDQFCFRKDMFSSSSGEQQRKVKQTKIKEKKAKLQQFYPPFLSEQIVIESKKRDQNKFFLGQLFLFNLYTGRIVTDEVSGDIQVKRQNINRAMHQSFVYFQFIKKQPSSDQQASEVEDQKQIKYCRIVCVKQNSLTNKILVGKLQIYGEQFCFQPINIKFRKMNIEKGKPDKNKKNLRQQYYTAKFISWEPTQKYPICELLQKFGTIGDIETECKVLLQMNEVYEGQFGPQTTQFLKKFTDRTSPEGEYIIPQEQYQKRYDLREQLIFTIDPLTARDFDDALSIKLTAKQQKVKYGIQTPLNVYEVGIHIADVSYFVQQNSPLDVQAQKRTTSVYLVHRVLPMLPRVLCQTMCSLNPGVERLVVTVWCYIDEEGNVLPKSRFGRSIIKSKARYTYQTAQQIIIDKAKVGQVDQNGNIKKYGAQNVNDQPRLFEAIKLMNRLATLMKSKRKSNGSLSIQNHKKQFKLDEDLSPMSYTISQRFDANFLVEQFMLLANIEVAQYVVRNLSQVSLLRRHMFPSQKKINRFKQFMKKFGLEFDINKETNLSDYITEILQNPSMKSSVKQLIEYELVFLLQAAEYFIVGDCQQSTWQHYALGFKQYTHFTSPIRRYPDIIVHRQLLKIIQSNNLKLTAQQKISSKALIQRCNKCKISARKVSSGCQKIFMCLYLKKNPVVNCRGIITQIGSSSLIVCIPQYDIKIPIVFKQIKSIKQKQFTTINQIKFLRIKYQTNTKIIECILRQTQYVNVNLSATNTFPIDYSVKLTFPNHIKDGKPIVLQ